MRRAVAAIAVVACLASACSDEPGAATEVAEVVVGEVARTVAAPAVVEPRRRTALVAEVPGEVTAVLVEDGDRVEAGQPIVVLESSSLDLQIEQAQAAVEAADALSGVQTGVDLSPVIAAVRGQLETVIPSLLDGLESQIEALPEGRARHEALSRLVAARANYEDSRDRLLAAESQARSTARQASASQQAAADAQREQAEVALDAARSQTDKLTITAPVPGVIEFSRAPTTDPGAAAGSGIGESLGGLLGGLSGPASGAGGPVSVGVGVAPGQTVATIYDLDGFHLSADVDEIDAVLVAEGQPATVLVDALGDREIDGRVTHVAVAPERAPTGGVTYPVRVDLIGLDVDLPLRVGLTASVEIEVQRAADVLVVPSSALLRRGGAEVVYVTEDGVAREVPVEVTLIGDGVAAVEGALEPGDEVVISDVADLEDGQELP